MFSLIKDNWILTLSRAFQVLWYIILAEVYEEHLSSYRHVVGEVRGIWSTFLRKYECSFKIIHHNLTSCFLKVGAVWNLKLYHHIFLYLVTLKSIGLACMLNVPFTCAWFSSFKLWLLNKYRFSELCTFTAYWHIWQY